MNRSRRRTTATTALVLLLAATGCSEDKKDARTFDSPGASTSADATTASSAASAQGSATATASPSAGAASAATTATAAPSATPLRSAGTDPALDGGPSALPARRSYVPPAAGDYTYANTGRNQISGCAVDDRPPPPTTGLQVSSVRGARQEAVRGDAEQGSQYTVVEYRDAGIYLVSLVIDQPGLGRIEFRPAAAVLLLLASPTVGKEWRFKLTSTDGKYTIDSTNRVTALRQPVRLGDGSTVSTTSVRSVTKLDGTSPIGTVDLDITTVSSVSADPALAVKEVADTKGTVGPCAFTSHVESLMRSVRPA